MSDACERIQRRGEGTADELLRLRRAEVQGSTSPLDVVISRRLEVELVDEAEAAGGALELPLCDAWGWGITVTTTAHREQLAAQRAHEVRRAAARRRSRRKSG